MSDLHQNNTRTLMDILITHVPEYFKFYGDVATELFLNDQLEISKKVAISVKRQHLLTVLNAIPEAYQIEGIDENGKRIPKEDIELKNIFFIAVKSHEICVLKIRIYDVDEDQWIFRLDNQIRIPEKHIYYHSLKWNVDFIKPEIILMFHLYESINEKQIRHFRHLIDRMSYFQFVTLKTVVGEERLRKVIQERSSS
ncbi:hypothetical protein [Staphylococcus hyicus]|uniref:hypothetical protein n=1 Tax=Staphylococcus hyicus TaxID=1284 RepID=UPI00057FE483|nr:hypothetical protein [Staphylococcus hyicus]AJC96292.1 hypothetical protein SHYC_07765 [Staphylococcus hyicus]SQE47977.1 Uncharacterised protein [Staphylococcus hyicus]